MNAILPTSYFPPISYFIYLENYDCKIEQYENYIKQTYRNRCHILGANGVLPLIIPINHNKTRIIKDIQVSYSEDWQKNHQKSLESAYRRSPYFEYYEDKLLVLFQQKPKYLIDLNLQTLETCLEILKLEYKTPNTQNYNKEVIGIDARNKFSPKNPSKINLKPYTQVFSDRFPFQKNLSIFDLICNLGPQSTTYIKEHKLNI